MRLHRRNKYLAEVTDTRHIVNFDSDATRKEGFAVARRHGVHFRPVKRREVTDRSVIGEAVTYISPSVFEKDLRCNFFLDCAYILEDNDSAGELIYKVLRSEDDEHLGMFRNKSRALEYIETLNKGESYLAKGLQSAAEKIRNETK